jgi:hypothetical protein
MVLAGCNGWPGGAGGRAGAAVAAGDAAAGRTPAGGGAVAGAGLRTGTMGRGGITSTDRLTTRSSDLASAPTLITWRATSSPRSLRT